MNKMTGEEFLQSKDIWNHPCLTDRNNKECYDVAELLDEYVSECQKDEEWGKALCKRQPLADGTLKLTENELKELSKIMKVKVKSVTVQNKVNMYVNNNSVIMSYKAIAYILNRFELIKEG